MTIDLPETRAYIRTKLESGEFADEAAVIAHVLDRWQQWERYTAEVRAKIDEGVKAAAEGRGTMISSPEEAAAFAETIKKRGRALRAERRRNAR